MIPHFQFISFQIGPLTIYVWGFFVVLGILTGIFLLYRRGFFKEDRNLNLILYLMFAAIIGGRLGYVLFYDLFYFLENPIDIFKIWQGGMSSFGGFLAATIVLLIILPKDEKLKYLDILTIPFIWVWIIGRIGCFMIHDHLGRLSNFFLAVRFPDGARHDMALYEILAMVVLLVGCRVSLRLTAARGKDQGGKPDILKSKKLPIGLITSITIIYYTTTRFFLDFLRATDLPNSDPRYFGLTPAQYGSILFFILGIILVRKILTQKSIFDRIKKD